MSDGEGGSTIGRVGTQERKRRERAEPDPAPLSVQRGCVVAFVVYVGLCAVWLAAAPGFWPVALSIPAVLLLIVAVVYFVRGFVLLSLVRVAWTRRGIRCLVVHSDSELWQERIATLWLPRIGGRSITFNWSQRATRKGSLESRVHRHFCGTDVNFNPAVIVFRGLRLPLVYRFYYAFRETRAGRPEYLERQEARMFESLGV